MYKEVREKNVARKFNNTGYIKSIVYIIQKYIVIFILKSSRNCQ